MKNKNTSNINIILSVNDRFVRPTCALINSIATNTKSNVTIYILFFKLSRWSITKIKEISNIYSNTKVEFVKFNLNDFMQFPSTSIYTSEVYLKLFGPFKINIDKGLYLDSDIVVKGDITELYNKNISNYTIAACPDVCQMDRINRFNSMGFNVQNYYNAGVLLINFDKYRKKFSHKFIVDFIQKNKETCLSFQDQDILNLIIQNNEWLKLEKNKYNNLLLGYDRDPSLYKESLIIHFAGNQKPWNAFSSKIQKQYFDEYWKYALGCGLKKFPLYYIDGIFNKIIYSNTYKRIYQKLKQYKKTQ